MSKYRFGTKRRMIEDLLDSGKTRNETYLELRPMVVNQVRPMVFSANVDGSRIPKPIHDQLVELRHEINRVAKIISRVDGEDFNPDEIEDTPEIEEPTPEPEPDEEPEPDKPVAKGKKRVEEELENFLRRVREIRKFCARRAELSQPLDSISMRPVQAASRLIPAGIPADFLLYSMTMHWPSDARAECSIFSGTPEEFSRGPLAEFSRKVMEEREIVGDFHELFGYVLLLAESRQPIMLVGPFGTGKSHLAKQVANFLGAQYGETPMTPGATRGDLLGRHTIGGFITSEFCELYSKGGVFNFEEIDASDPSMLIVLNNALAQNELYNSSSGEMLNRSEEFIAVSTANTFGLGANRDYTGRERLDAATIDRWRMGRVFVPLDETIEEVILYANHK